MSQDASDNIVKNSKTETLITKLQEVINTNLLNNQFGVEELAAEMNMSRSNLHRKIKQATGKSISRFIREYRLMRGIELLVKEDLTISEVAYRTGFASSSYFTTCFTEYYGYSPGEAKQKAQDIPSKDNPNEFIGKQNAHFSKRTLVGYIAGAALLLLAVIFLWIILGRQKSVVKEAPNTKSVAVLPFNNLNLNSDYAYFNEGVVGAISTHLSKIGNLNVAPQSSVVRYTESQLSTKVIAEELNVAYLLGGSTQRFEDKVRIEVYLIDASSEKQVWAEIYDRRFDDLLNIQSDIAMQVALELESELSDKEKAVLSKNGTESAEAYDLYLKGRYELRSWTIDGINLSTDLFNLAISLDSGFAQAYVGVASSYMYRAGAYSAVWNPEQAFSLAKPYLEKALILNPNLIEAHTWAGFYYMFGEWDFSKAEEALKKAIVSNDPQALSLYANLLNRLTRHEEALEIALRLDQTNPYYPITRMPLSLYYLGSTDKALEIARLRKKISHNIISSDMHGFLMLNTGKYVEAIDQFKEIIEMVDGVRHARLLGWMGAAFARHGDREEAIKLIEELQMKHANDENGSNAFFIGIIYNALNEPETALQWLEKSVDNHEMEVIWLISDPQLFSLHDHPAFQALADTVGFP